MYTDIPGSGKNFSGKKGLVSGQSLRSLVLDFNVNLAVPKREALLKKKGGGLDSELQPSLPVYSTECSPLDSILSVGKAGIFIFKEHRAGEITAQRFGAHILHAGGPSSILGTTCHKITAKKQSLSSQSGIVLEHCLVWSKKTKF